jgi:hypothetical protein
MANYLAQFQTIKSSCDRIVIAGTTFSLLPLLRTVKLTSAV